MSNRFDYVAYDAWAQEQQAEIKQKCVELQSLIDGLTPGRYQSLATTDLEKVYMWTGKAIRDEQIQRNGLAPLQEERTNS